MSSNTKKFAETELSILVETAEPENRPLIEEFIPEILELVDKFGESGQSGGSAPFTAHALSQTIEKLCLQQPICPITGEDKEWGDVTEQNGGNLYQNRRCYALFKTDKIPAYFLDAITWRTQSGATWSGNAKAPDGSKISSCQNIKSFPFTPKTFIIDTI